MAEPLLKTGEVVTIPARAAFSAREYFVANLEPRAPVRIAYVLGNFTRWLLDKQEPGGKAVSLRWYELQRNASDKVIVPELGGPERVESTLAAIFYLMGQQRAGQAGPMATNGWGNQFYVRDTAGVLRGVNIHWCDGGWGVEAVSIGRDAEWPIRDRVFTAITNAA